MNEAGAAGADDRVLVLAPTRKDHATTEALLGQAGIPSVACESFADALRELALGAAVLLIVEEILTPAHQAQLSEILDRQPAWSDLPVLVLTQAGANSRASAHAVETLGNVTLLERPLRVTTFLSAVRTATRARRRQYEIRGHLEDRVRAEEALREADQRKDEFLATLGHELRNPLAPLLSGLHLVRMVAPHDARLLRIIATMERQISHLVRLVDDLLEVSRITRGIIEVRHDPLDLTAVLRDAVESSRPALEQGRHHLTVQLPSTPIPIAGDPTRLTQVFANLLTNAAKYTDEGGRVQLSVERRDGRAIVSVKDNGIGIEASHLASVFEMFVQVDRSDRRAQGGLGIGLTLVRSLVHLHGGRVEARSGGTGQGTEFVVELPVLNQPLAQDGRSSQLPAFPRRRILVVDDNHDAADTLASLLEALGATVATANSGRDALERLQTFDPDAVLLDLGMPEMDGFEVARRLRAMPDRSDLLLIALTGWGRDQDRSRSQAAGFDHHLVKPPDIDKLRELLAR